MKVPKQIFISFWKLKHWSRPACYLHALLFIGLSLDKWTRLTKPNEIILWYFDLNFFFHIGCTWTHIYWSYVTVMSNSTSNQLYVNTRDDEEWYLPQYQVPGYRNLEQMLDWITQQVDIYLIHWWQCTWSAVAAFRSAGSARRATQRKATYQSH